MPSYKRTGGGEEVQHDDLGQLLVVPYFCRFPGCTTGWPSRQARGSHEIAHNPDIRRGPDPQPEPEVGTLAHYHWVKRRHGSVKNAPQADKDAWARYIRDRKKAKP